MSDAADMSWLDGQQPDPVVASIAAGRRRKPGSDPGGIDPRKPSRAVLADELRAAAETAQPAAPQPRTEDDHGPDDDRGRTAGDPGREGGGSVDASGGDRGRRDGRPRGDIWEDCPVKPLGVNGATYYYLDVHGQLRGLGKHDAQAILMLFGRLIPQLCWHFPQWSKDPDTGDLRRKPGRFDQTTAAMDMIAACSERGLFDPEGAVRGTGAWSDDDGQLVYHLGDRLLIGAEERAPDTWQGRIYPAYPPIPHPAPADRITGDPVGQLLDVIETWCWTRPDLDPELMLGLIGILAFGGALDWRPAFWITGGAGTGKSGLQRLLLHLMGGDKGLVQSTDPTARGIASMLQQSTLPVALDELEPGDTGSHKERDIIQTARVAASGGRWIRGSSDQKGASGQLRSTFLFSSILIPGVLKSQDLQRIITLSLRPFPAEAKPPDLRADTWRKRGAMIRRLIIDRWPSWARRVELWREACAAEGVTGRDADNWAQTLAMAQMMRSADLPSIDELRGQARKIARVIAQDRGERGGDHDEMLTWLLTQEYDVFRRGERYTVAQWIQVAAGSPGAPPGLLADQGDDALSGNRRRAEAANRALAKAMLKVVSDGKAPPTLFIGNKPVAPLAQLFEGSQWAGGAWAQSAARVPGAQASDVSRTLAGVSSRGWEIPLASIPGIMAGPDDPAEPAFTPRPRAPRADPQPGDHEDFA